MAGAPKTHRADLAARKASLVRSAPQLGTYDECRNWSDDDLNAACFVVRCFSDAIRHVHGGRLRAARRDICAARAAVSP